MTQPSFMRLTATRIFLVIILSAFIAITAGAQKLSTISLRNGNVSFINASGAAWVDSFRKSGATNDAQVLIKIPARPDANSLKMLADAGVALHDYLGHNIYLALLSAKGTGILPGTVSITQIPVALKWTGTSLPASSGSKDFVVSILSERDFTALSNIVKLLGGRLKASPLAAHSLYEISLPAAKMMQLAGQSFVKTIGPAADDQPLNLEAQRATKTNLAHAPLSSGGYGLLGDSITIGVGDNISGVFHVDTRDRVINFNNAFATFTNHGQHVNGTVGGAGTLDPAAEGFAPHATLVDHLYNLVWARTGTMQHDFGMSVTNNSYASVVNDCSFAGVYDAYAQALDTIALQFPNVLHVFAAGNDGGNTCGPYPAGFGTVTGGYQPAKNVLVVGNVTRSYESYYNSSRGPTKDGRIKPEIVTTGSNVYSTGKFDTYLEAGATSFSSPQVSGASGLLQQRYKQLHSGAYPPSDLVKCLLLNGAMDIGNPGPDFTNGFGVLDVARSLGMIDSNHFFTNSISANTAQNNSIVVPPNAGQLKIMLYWHDVPASPLADSQLVNDLDLEVTDPNAVLHRPLVLNAAPAHILDNAIEGADHLNNAEQIVINNPVAGSYSVKVKSSAITSNTQRYIVAFDMMPDAVQVSFPNTGTMVKAGDSLRIYWDASQATQAFNIELSTNAGAAWTSLGTVPANQHYLVSLAPNISSEQCRVRITRGSQQSVSGNFVINLQPALSLSATQCPGYMNLQWTAVPNATGYQVLRKKGYYLQPEAVVTGTSYSISGLSVDSTYYAAVQPLINGVPGYRSTGVKRLANDGTCAGNFSDGDLSIQKIISPQSGRQGTSTALPATDTLVLLAGNNDDVTASAYTVFYRINSGAWQSTAMTTLIPAAGSAVIKVPGINLSAVGSYTITAVIKNSALSDNVTSNDTLVRVVRNLANLPVTLAGSGFTDDFESSPAFNVAHDSVGITANDRWDFYNTSDTGRIRSFVTSDVLIGGNRSISMDQLINVGGAPVANFFTGTFNTAAYTTATSEVRLQFDYKLHGRPFSADSNTVWARGSDTQPWQVLYRYDLNAKPGAAQHSGSQSVTDALLAGGQNFTSSTQIRFGQRDTALIALNDFGNGLTLDNVKLYSVQNDAAILDVVSPKGATCALSAATPLTIKVYNGVTNTLSNVSVSYQLDGGTVQTESIATLAGKTAINYTFTQAINAAAPGTHTLKVWLSAAGDTYHENDSILNYTFRNEPLIASFPYLENFESGDGYFYADGLNSSWGYGSPSSAGVRRAASGTKAWKTNLSGSYNDNELSYLYTPCFDVSGLTHPMLSFSAVVNVEDCGSTLCDAAWVEYSNDGGASWNKLGATGQGYSWYTDTARNIWKIQGDNRWHVASIPLPGAASIRFRFVLSSDAGTGFEGLAIDDVHIYDKAFPIYTGGNSGPINATTTGTQWTPFIKNDGLIAETRTTHTATAVTEGQLYAHSNLIDSSTNKYFLPRSYTLKLAAAVADSILARLYVPDSEVLVYLRDTTCPTCSRAADAYRLGILKYDDGDKSNENGTMQDNLHGIYNFIPYNKVAWVPYDRGYYAEVAVPSLSELWFYDSGPAIPVPSGSVDFNATMLADSNIMAEWSSSIDSLVTHYELQRAKTFSGLSNIYSVNASLKPTPAQYAYIDTPNARPGDTLFYRLHWTLVDGSQYYSSVHTFYYTIPPDPKVPTALYPNPVQDGKLYLSWNSPAGTGVQVVITDAAGKKLRDISGTAAAGNNKLTIDMRGVAPGIYFVRTTIGGAGFTQKIVVK